jgi:hypothetical protein
MNSSKHKIKQIIKIIIGILFLSFILFDLSNSFEQYKGATLDGDIAESVLPYPNIQKTFNDPTGIKTIINNDRHLGTNRFFSHYFLHKTFREVPLLLQNFCEPIDSVYYTAAIAKLIMQISILLLLVFIINGNFKIFSLQFIAVTAIVLSFFQTNGWLLIREMGIIDPSISYSFSYALPFVFLLLYYIPLFLNFLHNKNIKMNGILILLWTIIAIISCFSGPLISPVILITNFILLCHLLIKNWETKSTQSFFRKIFTAIKKIDKKIYLFLVPISILALYSTFLGTYIDAYEDIRPPLKDMYLLLPKGIWNSFFNSISYAIMLFLLIANYLIISLKYKNREQTKKIINLYRFLIVFTVIYLLFLPFGGYRPYRPLLLRYDTILPITIFSIITICYGILFIFKQLHTEKWKHKLKIAYCLCIPLILLFFIYKDKKFVFNECEKASLAIIANSKEDVVVLDNDCSVVSWLPIYNPEETKFFGYGELLYLWNIIDKPKLYYNLPKTDTSADGSEDIIDVTKKEGDKIR